MTGTQQSVPLRRRTRAVASWVAVVATSLALIVGPGQTPAQARPGDLDPTFGVGGKWTTDFAGSGDKANAVIVQSDGKVVAAGTADTFGQNGSNTDFALARYNPDGSPDLEFGPFGTVTTDFGGFPPVDAINALVQQADGKLVVAGGIFTGSSDLDTAFALARYNPNGTLDSTFGTGGKVTTDFAKNETAFGLAVQADGKLVAAGTANSAEGSMFGLVRYNPDGTLDPTFGTGGTVTTAFDGGSVFGARSLAVQADGKLVLAGTVASGQDGNLDFALARYQPDGALDPTFGSGGRVTTDLMGDDNAEALVVQADGKLVAAGSVNSATAFDFALARYQPDGALDPTFDRDGKVTTDFGSSDGAKALALQADGKLVAAGFALRLDVGNDFALARYKPNGALDRTFGQAGRVTTDFAGSSPDDQVNGLAVQADGRLVAAGFAGEGGGSSDFALARYRTQ
jgi:uncharacterized delta-60 repeat protein